MEKTVAVIGLGRVGLPLALVLSEKKYLVHGIDCDRKKIDTLKKGKMPFMENDAGKLLKENINSFFFPSSSYRNISKSSIVILTLGTPVDANMNPVFDQIEIALQNAVKYFHKGQLIILRSTVSPGTTQYVLDWIEKQTELKVGTDLYLAFCPERIAEGMAIKEIKELPQIVGGINQNSTSMAVEFFKSFGVQCLRTDAKTAELSKLFTNMYRYINFAIANEFAVIAENFDSNIYTIVDLVNRGYARGGLALPGLTAGPCLFKDGFFLINDNPFLDLISASWKINETMPLFLVNKIKKKTALKGKTIALLGLAFKPEVDDTRESLSFKLRKALLREHAEVLLHDPYVKSYSNQKISKNVHTLIKKADIIIVATNHKYYRDRADSLLALISQGTIICDIWNVFKKDKMIFSVRNKKQN